MTLAPQIGNALVVWLMSPEAEAPFSLDELLHRPAWHARAACRGSGSTRWVTGGRRARHEEERAVCSQCPVSEPCFSYALADASLKGCSGGTAETERKRIRDSARDLAGLSRTLWDIP